MSAKGEGREGGEGMSGMSQAKGKAPCCLHSCSQFSIVSVQAYL